MDSIEIIKIITEGWISGVAIFVISVLQKELRENRSMMAKLIEVNEKQNNSIHDLKNELVRLSERLSKK